MSGVAGELDCSKPCSQLGQGGELASKCAEYSLKKTALASDQKISVLLSATMSACWMACFSAAPPSSTACTVAGLAADVASIVAIANLSMEGERWIKATDKATLILTGASALIDGSEAFKKMAVNSDRVKEAQEHESRTLPCAAAAINTVLVGLALNDLVQLPKEIDATCLEIQSLSSKSAQAVAVNGGDISVKDAAPQESSHSTKSVSHVEIVEGVSKFLEGYEDQTPLSAPDQMLMNLLPNKALVSAALESHGFSLNDIARQLENSPSVVGVTLMIPGFPAQLEPFIFQLENEVRQGQISARNFAKSDQTQFHSLVYGHRPYSELVIKRPTTVEESAQRSIAQVDSQSNLAAPASQLSSAPPGGEILDAPDVNDIWHHSWRGNIFQLVSYRVNSVQIKWQKDLDF